MPSIDVDGVTIELPPDDTQAQKVPQYNAAFIALAAEVAALSLGMDASSAHLSGDLLVDGTITGGFLVGDGAGITNVVNSFNTREGAVVLLASDLNGLDGSGLVFSDLTISGTFTATNLAGNGSAITGVIAAGTGGTSSTGALGLISDSDNTGGADRRIDFIHGSGGSSLTALSLKEEKLGFETTSPIAMLDMAALPPGGTEILRLRTNEAGSGPMGISFYANDFGVTRKDFQMIWGYNGGPNRVTGEHSFIEAIESRYSGTVDDTPSQLEYYFDVTPGSEASGPWAISYRPFSMTQSLQDSSIITRFRVMKVDFAGYDNDQGWLQINSLSGVGGLDGNLTLTRESGIAFDSNTKDWPMSADGGGWLGTYDSKFSVLQNTGSNGEVVLFGGGNPATYSYKISVGGASGFYPALTWEPSSGGKWQYTARTEADTYVDRAINDELGRYQFQWGLSRALAAASGSYSELGTFTPDSGSGLLEVVVSDTVGDTARRFTIAGNYTSYNNGSTWQEVSPDVSSGDRDGDIALDIRGNTGMVRLRRSSTSAGSKTYYVTVKSYSQFASVRFTPTTGTGTGASVGGLFPNKTISEVAGTLYFNDGTLMQAVSIGAADSGGSGYRLLRIPN